MANHKSSLKRIRQTKTKTLHNKYYAKTMRNAVRKLRAMTDKEEAVKLQAEYEDKLSQAAATSERLVKEATVRAQGREEEIIREANERAEAIRAKASADIAQEKKKALNDAKDEISVIALAIAGKVVGRELDAEDQRNLVDSFIEELGE